MSAERKEQRRCVARTSDRQRRWNRRLGRAEAVLSSAMAMQCLERKREGGRGRRWPGSDREVVRGEQAHERRGRVSGAHPRQCGWQARGEGRAARQVHNWVRHPTARPRATGRQRRALAPGSWLSAEERRGSWGKQGAESARVSPSSCGLTGQEGRSQLPKELRRSWWRPQGTLRLGPRIGMAGSPLTTDRGQPPAERRPRLAGHPRRAGGPRGGPARFGV